MITASNFLTAGRLGNILFRYASLIGLAKRYGQELRLPAWGDSKYFSGKYPQGEIENKQVIRVSEPVFHYTPHLNHIKESEHVDIQGYLQSPKYFAEARQEVKDALSFTQEFKDQCWNNFFSRSRIQDDFRASGKKTIGISIRRGDYIGNQNYVNLPVTYFILALFERFPDRHDKNIVIFSDDIPWCRVHFGTLDNVYFSENNSAIEDLCLLSQCDEFLLSNSTFSYFGALIAELQHPVKVVRPNHLFAGRLLRDNSDQDFWPRNWEIFDHLNEWSHRKKIDLRDCSFHIPVFYDHQDREENLNVVLKVLADTFDTEIIVMEQGGTKFQYLEKDDRIKYRTFPGEVFHRTRMLNQMAQETTKPYIINFDADILMAPLQLWATAQALRKGAEMVYPYSGAFARIPRQVWFTRLQSAQDIGIVGDTRFSGQDKGDAVSLGGLVAWNKNYFLSIGGENEKFISYGAEDVERYERSIKLGARIERVHGPLYHINHYTGVNSNTSNPYYLAGRDELIRIRSLSADQLREEVKTWPKGK